MSHLRSVSRRRIIALGGLAALGAVAAACQAPAAPTAAPAQPTAVPAAPTAVPAAPTAVPAAAATATSAPAVEATAVPAADATAVATAAGGATQIAATQIAGQTGAAGEIVSGQSLFSKETPKSGGIYRMTSPGDLRGLDPGSAEGSEDWWAAGWLLYNYLYFYDWEGNIYADVASDFPEISADGLTYTIPIRKGVTFHNGREVKAEDVAFSLAWTFWPEIHSWGKSYGANIAGYQDVIDGKSKEFSGVKVVDDYTITITLDRAQAVFLALLSYTIFGIIPKAEVEAAGLEFGQKVVIGTGPFKLKEWVQGQTVEYEKHTEYFRAPKPYLDGVHMQLNVDGAQGLLKFEAGETESTRGIPAAEMQRILADPDMADMLRVSLGLGTTKWFVNMKTEPFASNLLVRQAVAHAIDKDKIIKLGGGTAFKLEGFYAKGMLQFDPNFKSKYQFDPEKAKALMAEAGFADGIKGVLVWVGAAGPSTLDESVQQDLKNIGIETEFVPGDRKSLQERNKAGEIGMRAHGWSASAPDAFDYMAYTDCVSAKDPESWNDANYCNPRIDELLKIAEALPLTDDKRIAAYREIEDIVINQDVVYTGIMQGKSISLSKPYCHNDWPIPIAGYPFLEHAWMSDH